MCNIINNINRFDLESSESHEAAAICNSCVIPLFPRSPPLEQLSSVNFMLKITEDFLNRLSRVVQRKASYGEIYQITSADGAPVQVVQKKPPPWIVSVKKKRRRRLSNSWPLWLTCIKQVYIFVALACFQLLYLQYIFSQVLLENGLLYSVLKLLYFIIIFILLLQGG